MENQDIKVGDADKPKKRCEFKYEYQCYVDGKTYYLSTDTGPDKLEFVVEQCATSHFKVIDKEDEEPWPRHIMIYDNSKKLLGSFHVGLEFEVHFVIKKLEVKS